MLCFQLDWRRVISVVKGGLLKKGETMYMKGKAAERNRKTWVD